jgi:nucleoside diphosphate kinase
MYQETLVILKPDALERNKTGAVIKYYEDAGLEVLDMKFYEKVTTERLMVHYPDTMALSIGKKAQAAVPSIKDAEAHGLKVLTALRGYLALTVSLKARRKAVRWRTLSTPRVTPRKRKPS